jgi:eukaryotic-like serine/threonine-protein kinase
MSGAPPPGTILAGKYRVDGVLGEGGMGIVVRAHHEVLHQQVALKFLTGAAATNGDAVERFLREARAAVKIQSEHIARIVDVGTLDTGSPFMVMELLEGADLSDVIRTQGPMHVAQAVDCVLQAIDAIAEAHAIGIIHRDLKPSNLFLASRADGTDIIKVLDFGISKVTFAEGSTAQAALTSTQTMMGSPLYMSPEQFRSAKKVDPRTDIWSLGVILYELLTGIAPFDGETMGEVFAAVLENEPAPVRSLRPDVPPPLEQAIMRCLRKSPKERFVHAGELARALAPFGSGRANKCVERASHLATRAASRQPESNPSISGLLPQIPATTQTGSAPHAMAPMKRPVAQTANTWSEVSSTPVAKRSRTKLFLLAGLGVGVTLLVGVPVVLALNGRAHGPATADTATAIATAPASASAAVPSALGSLDLSNASNPSNASNVAAGGSAPATLATTPSTTGAPTTPSTTSAPASAPPVSNRTPTGLPTGHTSRPHASTATAPTTNTPTPPVPSTAPKPSAKPGTVDMGRL